MRGRSRVSHAAAGLQVIVGHPFTFTHDEEKELYTALTEARFNLQGKPTGWRSACVMAITKCNRTVARALARAQKQPDPRQMDLPIGPH